MESTATTTDTLRDEETAKSYTANVGIAPPNSIVEPTAEAPGSSSSKQEKDSVQNPKRGFQFWAIIVALCIVGLLAALENTVVTTSLPTIVNDLSIGENYIWITNIFFLTSAAVQPLFGQLANIFGRRWLTIIIVAVYTLGSGICGGANSGGMLIAGRAIQGIGSGGINMIVDVIISDLVPLRERGNFIAIILTVYSVGTGLGPFTGGKIVQTTTWRWVFYINLPVGGVALALLVAFLHVNYKKEMTLRQKLKRIDFVGNGIIMASSVSVLMALTYAGTRYAWSSWRILLPLVLGLSGFGLFMLWESSPYCIEPVMPPRLFKNRTSAIVYANTFNNSILLYWVIYLLPVYFQAVLGSTPARSGVQVLPIVVIAVPGAVISVLVLTKFGRYKQLHFIGFALMAVGLGLFSILDANSPTVEWVMFQVLGGGGSGMILNTLLPAFQAGLAESDQAAATASWAFIRSFGNVWGVAIPAAIFNNRFENLSYRISDPAVRNSLTAGRAYESATSVFVNSFHGALRQEIIGVYSDALKLVWEIAIVFAGIAFFLVFLEKEIKLRTELDTEFGLVEKKKDVDMEDGLVEKKGGVDTESGLEEKKGDVDTESGLEEKKKDVDTEP